MTQQQGSAPTPINPETGEDESASRPSPITGAFLRCGILLDATDSLPTTEVGCRIEDKDANRIDPASLGLRAIYAAINVPNGVKVAQRILTSAIRNFDILFDFQAASKLLVQDAVNKAVFTVDFNTIIENRPIGSQNSTLPQAKATVKRGDWISFLTDASPTYMDASTSLVWALDDGKGYTLEEGESHCNDLIYAGNSNWRLPTITELQTAQLNGLGVAYADAGNMNIDSGRFGGYGASTLEFPDQPPVIGQSRRWNINLSQAAGQNTTLVPVENRQSVICVHE